MTENELWTTYWKTRDPDLRNRIIEEHLDYVVRLAQRLKANLPEHIDLDDLVGYGVFGLIEAVDRFEPGYGASFKTFATVRIRGAMLDGLRTMDFAPTSLRRKERRIVQAIEEFVQEHNRMPASEEVAATLGMSQEEYEKIVSEVQLVDPLSLSVPLADDSTASLLDMLADPDALCGVERIERQETLDLVAKALETLTDRERLVLSLYYERDLTLEEIGNVLGVTRFRVSQIHKQAILKIRGYISRFEKHELAPAPIRATVK